MFQIGNERVALVTDTSCDLSDEQLSQYDIRTVALRVATSQGAVSYTHLTLPTNREV